MIKQLKASLQLAQMRYKSNDSKENKEILKRATEQYEAEIAKESDPESGMKKPVKKENPKTKEPSGGKVVPDQTDTTDDASDEATNDPVVSDKTDEPAITEEKKTEAKS
tara:strand:- start:709 stop:1035 length:327 start_codon:yes stop_codon:yes gene_type:complete